VVCGLPSRVATLKNRSKLAPVLKTQPTLAATQVLRMPLEEFRALMLGGDMLLPSITTGFMAIDKLREQGLV